ncbi:hypothetical protein V5799_025791, partial [Amblyomma americanum]
MAFERRVGSKFSCTSALFQAVSADGAICFVISPRRAALPPELLYGGDDSAAVRFPAGRRPRNARALASFGE